MNSLRFRDSGVELVLLMSWYYYVGSSHEGFALASTPDLHETYRTLLCRIYLGYDVVFDNAILLSYDSVST
jgi:hypothetical protein